MYFRLF